MSSSNKRARRELDSDDDNDDIELQLRHASQLCLNPPDNPAREESCQLQSQLLEASCVRTEFKLTNQLDLPKLQLESELHSVPLSSPTEGLCQLPCSSKVNTEFDDILYSQLQSVQTQLPVVLVNAANEGETQLQFGPEMEFCPADTDEDFQIKKGPKLMENSEPFSEEFLHLDSSVSVEHFSNDFSNLDSALNVQEDLTKDEFINEESLLHLQHGLDLTQSWEGEEELREMFSCMLLNAEDREFEADESKEDYEEDTPQVNGERPLYPGAPLSLHESFTSILTLALTYKLSGAALQGVLNLIAIHLPNKEKNLFKSSLSFFKKYFSYIQGPKSFEYYCSICYKKCADRSGCDVCKNSKVCYLVQLSLIQQLQTMFKRDGFYDKLSLPKQNEHGAYQDIYSGTVYTSAVNENYLGEEGQLSGQIYTDGAALYESANVSVWPVYITINELPYEDRFKKENILLPAIWCGPTKPPGNVLLASCYPELAVLANGVKLEAKDIGEVKVSIRVVAATGDTPARSLMLNMCQFNGANSCQCCEQPGEPRPDCPGVRYFPYKPHQMALRTVDSMNASGAIGTEKKPNLGVKGPTVLSKIMPNFVDGMAIDPQHHIYAGCGKKILKLLTDSSAKAKKWSISKFIILLNEKLLKIKPPAHIPRVPRAISELSYWKLSELKAWLLHYSLPVLEGILPIKYLQHHATLVAAVQLLSADVVSLSDIATARDLLTEYVAQYADFYHQYFMTINVHLLLHLPDLVMHLGPLWVYSCFPLEGLNGQILNLVHGTRWAEKQIASSVQLTLGLPDLVATLKESAAKKFCQKLLRPKRYGGCHIGDAIIVGKIKDVQLEPNIQRSLQDNYGISASRANKFTSLKQVIKKLSPTKFFDTLLQNVTVPNTFGVTETNDIRVIPRSALSSIYFPSKPYVSTVSSLLRFACEVMLTTTRSAADNIIVYNQKIDKGVLTTE
ncbi:hypothetical protein FOCC_FOCC011023 [Frankliniella occidentalis]|nr:hypothetical protein FOCC_FOCC011023 [Frankliniella occidentalis]